MDTFYLYDSEISYNTMQKLIESGLFELKLIGVIKNKSIFEVVLKY